MLISVKLIYESKWASFQIREGDTPHLHNHSYTWILSKNEYNVVVLDFWEINLGYHI